MISHCYIATGTSLLGKVAFSFIYVYCYKQHSFFSVADTLRSLGGLPVVGKSTNLKTAISLTGVLRLRKYRAYKYVGRL